MIVLKHKYFSSRTTRASGGAVGAALRHISYIKHRGGVDRDKKERQFFDSDNDEVAEETVRDLVKNEPGRNVVVHKLMFSPDIQVDDPKKYIRDAMLKFAHHKGLDLNGRWAAVVHRNTENPHVHLVLMGTDTKGRKVTIRREDHRDIRGLAESKINRLHPERRLAKDLAREAQRRDERFLKREAKSRDLYRDRYKLPSFRVRQIERSFPKVVDQVRSSESLERDLLRAGGISKFTHGGKEFSYHYDMPLDKLEKVRSEFSKDALKPLLEESHTERLADIARLRSNENVDEFLKQDRESYMDRLETSRGGPIPYSSTDVSGQAGGSSGLQEGMAATGSLTEGSVKYIKHERPNKDIRQDTEIVEKDRTAFFAKTPEKSIEVEQLQRLAARMAKIRELGEKYRARDNKRGAGSTDDRLNELEQQEKRIKKQSKKKQDREKKERDDAYDRFDSFWND